MKPVVIPNTFAAQTGPIPLSQLDADITALANSVNDLGTYSNYLIDSSGSANQINVTIAAGLTVSVAAGLSLQVKVANTSTSQTVMLNCNGIGNYPVVNSDNSSPTPGQFVAGQIVDFIFDGTSFRVFGTSNSYGVYNATLTGCSATTQGTVLWTKIGNVVILNIASIFGPSNTTACTLLGLPANLQPLTQNVILPVASFQDNSTQLISTVTAAISAGSGSIVFAKNGSTTGFTASGTKGPYGTCLVYSVP